MQMPLPLSHHCVIQHDNTTFFMYGGMTRPNEPNDLAYIGTIIHTHGDIISLHHAEWSPVSTNCYITKLNCAYFSLISKQFVEHQLPMKRRFVLKPYI